MKTTNKIIKLTNKLISFESTKEKPQELQNIINFTKEYLKEFKYLEFNANNSPSIFFYNKKNKYKKFKIILNAHLDVVSGTPDQFKPFIVNDRLIGRGSCDMKGGAAVQILAFKNLANKVNYPIGLQLVSDEETGGFNGTLLQLKKGIKTDFSISGEATDLAINNQAKGVFDIKLTVKGKPAHAAYLWNGDNALNKLINDVNNILNAFPVPKNEVWKTTCNLSLIKTSNTATNKVPSDAEAVFDFRFVAKDKDTLEKKINNLVSKDTKITILENEPTQNTEKVNKYIKIMEKSLSMVIKEKARFISTHGASDIRHFEKFQQKGICFGPVGKNLHSDNEWVSIKSLYKNYQVLEDFLLRLNNE